MCLLVRAYWQDLKKGYRGTDWHQCCVVCSKVQRLRRRKIFIILGTESISQEQGWEFAHSLIAHSLISLKSNKRLWAIPSDRSRQMSAVSESLRWLKTNERPWAICSGRSQKMSDRERIAQVAHQTWANERIARFFSELLIRSFLGKKRPIRSENRWANSQPCIFFPMSHHSS